MTKTPLVWEGAELDGELGGMKVWGAENEYANFVITFDQLNTDLKWDKYVLTKLDKPKFSKTMIPKVVPVGFYKTLEEAQSAAANLTIQ